MNWRSHTLLIVIAATAIGSGCQGTPDRGGPEGRVALAPGTISVPFRNRWWHFYERGLSWADASLEAQAESDFRQCLRLRQTDSRLARTYGMHFVQCFAHRELGAVLLRQGRLDEAERELRLSLEQEPSAKAEFLLNRLHELRGGAVAAPVPAPAPPAGPMPTRGRIEIATAVQAPGAPAQLLVSGHLSAGVDTALWSIDGQGGATRVAADASGSFNAVLASDASLALGTAAGPDRTSAPPVPVLPPAAAPTLEIDGPDQGAVVADGRAWYRWHAASLAGLTALDVADESGTRLLRLDLTGLRAAGTLRVSIPAGLHSLRFVLADRADASLGVDRSVDSRPSPQQDRGLRAVALAIPLQAPRPGAMLPGDDPRLLSALIDDGRFRFLDLRADEILARELSMVEAGLVDRATAAAAGRRLACRYVIAGTLNRSGRDAECFLRLVHCDSGRVVVSADAYAELSTTSDAEALFAAASGRLRQAFPVVAGTLARDGDSSVRLDLGTRSGAVALMRLHVFAESPAVGHPAVPSGMVEVVEANADDAHAIVVSGSMPPSGWGVSE